jgi:hypothetical protein
MNAREMKRELMDFLIREFMKDEFAQIRFLHFIHTDTKKLTPAARRRISWIVDELALKYSALDIEFELLPGRK